MSPEKWTSESLRIAKKLGLGEPSVGQSEDKWLNSLSQTEKDKIESQVRDSLKKRDKNMLVGGEAQDPAYIKSKYIELAEKEGIEGPKSDSKEDYNKWLNTISDSKKQEFDAVIAEESIGGVTISNLIRNSVSNQLPINTTEEAYADIQKGFVGGALTGAIESIPSFLGGGKISRVIRLFAQAEDATMRDMENNPAFEGVSENEKRLVSAPISIATAILEEVGFRNVIASKGLLNGVVARALGKSGASTTARTFADFIRNDVDNMIARGTLKLVGGALAEAETGALQQGVQLAVQKIYNEVKEKKMYKLPEDAGGVIADILRSGAQEAIGGFVLGMPSAVSAAYTKKGFLGMNDATFKAFEAAANDENIQKAFVTKLKNQVNQGEITIEQAKETLNNYRNSIGLFKSMPEGLDTQAKKEAMNLLKEKRDLENQTIGKDPALVKPLTDRINAINESLTKLSEDAIQKQATDESVLRTGEPQVGLQEVGEGNVQPEGTTAGTESQVLTESGTQEVISLSGLVEQKGEFNGTLENLVSINTDNLTPLNEDEEMIAWNNKNKAKKENNLTDKEWAESILDVPSSEDPINATLQPDGKIVVTDGHHRLLAAKILGKDLAVNLKVNGYVNEKGKPTINEYLTQVSSKTQPIDIQQEVTSMEEKFGKEFPTAPTTDQGVSVTNKSAVDNIKTKTTDKGRVKVIEAAERVLKTLKSVLPNFDIVLHEDEGSYNAAMESLKNKKGQGTKGNFSIFKNGSGRIDINLSRANNRTVAHEVAHAVMAKAFNGTPQLYKGFRDSISKVLNESSNKKLMDFAKKYTGEVTYEEYLAELTAMLEQEETNLSVNTLQKIAAIINKIVSKITNGKFKPFEDIKDTKQVVEFFKSISESIRKGEEISPADIEAIQEGLSLPIGSPTNINRSQRGGTLTFTKEALPLSFVTEADKIDINKLIDEIIEKKQNVWFWMADQLGRGNYYDAVIGNDHYLDAGPSFALDPKNRSKNILWASGLADKTLQSQIDKADYIFFISGSPEKAKLFNRRVLDLIASRINKTSDFNSFKDAMNNFKTETNELKDIKDALVKINSFDELAKSPRRKAFLIAIDNVGKNKTTPKGSLKELLGSFNAFIDYNELRDGFYKENDFTQNDIMLVGKPTGLGGSAPHSTYETAILGEVIGVPDTKIDSWNIMPQALRDKYQSVIGGRETKTKAMQAKVIAAETGVVRGLEAQPTEVKAKANKAESFFNDADVLFPNDDIRGGYAVTDEGGKQIGRIKMSEVNDNTVKIDEVVSEKRGQRTGNGSAIMKMVIDNADKNNVTLTLTPNLIGEMKAKGFETAEKLRSFYEKFGFVKDKGKATMTREPNVSEVKPESQPTNLLEGTEIPISKSQIIGENAKMSAVVKNNLDKAKFLETQNETPLNIKIQTGWEVGKEGKWRYEIPDGKLKDIDINDLKKEIDTDGKVVRVAKLSDVFTAPDLFEAYPEAKDLKVIFKKLANNTRGTYVSLRGVIEINQDLINTDRVKTDITVLHEIQHYIQEKELFENGSSPDYTRKYMDYMLKKLRNTVKYYKDMYDTAVNNMSGYNPADVKKSLDENIGKYKKLRELANYKNKKGEKPSAKRLATAYNIYYRIAGEVEARNVGNRMNLTMDEKRKSLLSETEDINREDQILFENEQELYKNEVKQMEEEFPISKSQVDAFSGGPYEFDKFSTSKIGTGEGNQAFGWGLYFSTLKSIAQYYANALANISNITLDGMTINEFLKKKGLEKKYKNAIEDNNPNLDLWMNALIDTIKKASTKSEALQNINEKIKEVEDNIEYANETINYKDWNMTAANIKMTESSIRGLNRLLQDYNFLYDSINDVKEYKAKLNKFVYQVSLHEGKKPSEYTWLEWDKPIKKDVRDRILERFIQENDISKKDLNKLIEDGIQYADADGIGIELFDEMGLSINEGMAIQTLLDEEYVASGLTIYDALQRAFGNNKQKTSEFLLRANIDGVKYPAESVSRGATSEDARGFNYVVFDENAITIKAVFKSQQDATNVVNKIIKDQTFLGEQRLRCQ